MESTRRPSEATTPGILTTLSSTIGLALGPSVIAVLTVSPYIGPIEKEFGWSRVQVSLAFTIVAYMIVLVSPLQGLLADRFGPRRVVLTSIPLFAASLAALYFTPRSLLVYYALWALVPIAAIGLWPLGYLQVVSRWFDRKLGLALGVANAGIGLGSTFVPMIVGGTRCLCWQH
jgi:MFS family permease